ncbi:MAG: diversity-generating retroelement protein Avd [Candidatus Moraniibacteriota bacterium]
MDEMDIPIFKKTYDLYKEFYSFRLTIPKQDRYALWQKCETTLLDTLEAILLASQLSKKEKLPALEQASLKLNLFRVFVRLSKEVKAIDTKKYIALQEKTDEIGRMLGGWIRSSRID